MFPEAIILKVFLFMQISYRGRIRFLNNSYAESELNGMENMADV